MTGPEVHKTGAFDEMPLFVGPVWKAQGGRVRRRPACDSRGRELDVSGFSHSRRVMKTSEIARGNLTVTELRMDAVQQIDIHRQAIEGLCRQFAVKRLRLFGSALSRDWDPESSDFDFIAEFDEPPPGINRFHQLVDLVVAMEALFARRVDVVDWDAATNPIFRRNAESSAQLLYAA